MTAPLLTTSTLAAHSACQVVGRATPNMLVNPGVSREADDQQIDGIFPDEIANYPDHMSGRNHGLEVYRMQRRARPAMFGKLPEVAIGAVFLFAQLIDHLGVAGNFLLHAYHAKTRANARCKLDGKIEDQSQAGGSRGWLSTPFHKYGLVVREDHSLTVVAPIRAEPRGRPVSKRCLDTLAFL